MEFETMKKSLLFLMVASVLSLALSPALAHPDTPRPDGVTAEAWISLGPDAGFVVTEGVWEAKVVTNGAVELKRGINPTVNRYLMARRDGKWIRLDPQASARIVPTS
jgi:hypothetical protein